jgi:hypothetical protein
MTLEEVQRSLGIAITKLCLCIVSLFLYVCTFVEYYFILATNNIHP